MKIWRLLILTIVLFGISLLLHLYIYGPKLSIDTVSNATFVVGIVIFLPSLIALTGANQVFHGMGYLLKLVFNKNAKHEFPTYRDYKEHKASNNDTAFYKELLIASVIVLLVGIILAVIVIKR